MPSNNGEQGGQVASSYEVCQLDEVPPVPCPCGLARRGFAGRPENVASVHLVDIKREAKVHYHKGMTEIYVVLEGEGFIELDGVQVAVKPLTAVYIKPGCRHRAIGNLRIINLPVPPFDPQDEWFD